MTESRRNRPAHLQLLAISWNFGWPVAAGVIIGHWIDDWLGSSPMATLVIGLGAMAGGVWRMIQLGKRDLAEIEQIEADEQQELEQRRSSRPGGEDR